MNILLQILGFLLFGILLLPSSAPWAQPVNLSLEQAITLALASNPQVEAARQQVEQAAGRITQATAGYLPKVSVGASAGRMHFENLSPTEEDSVVSAGVSASQLLYDFGRTVGGIEAAKFSEQAATAGYSQTLQDIVYEVERSYYRVVEKDFLVGVAQEAVNNYEQHLYRAQKFFAAGIRTQIDITNAELELANARLGLLRANSEVKTARTALEQVLGQRPADGNYRLETSYNTVDSLSTALPPFAADLGDKLLKAKTMRPGLQEVAALSQSAQAGLKSARGDNWPVLGLTGSYDEYETDLASLTDQWQLTAGLSWEIFSGFATQGKIAEAQALVRELAAAQQQLWLAVVQEVTDSYLRADENRQAVDLAALSLKLAKENLRLAEGRYQAGLSDMIEFNDAQLNYTTSQSNLVTSYFTYLTALASLERAAGTVVLPDEVAAVRN